MFLSCQQKKKRHINRILALCLLPLALLASASGQAAISLDHSIKSGPESLSFSRIAAMTALADGTILAVDSDQGTLLKFKQAQGESIKLTGDQGVFSSGRLGGLSPAGENMLAVSNIRDNKIAIITTAGELVVKMGNSGSDYGKISEPHGVAYSVNRRVYVADTDNNRISVFGSDGVFLHTMGQQGLAEQDRLREPVQVYVDSQEQIYVFEAAQRGQVAIFTHDGSLIKRLTHDRLTAIVGNDAEFSSMTIDKAGLLYLADSRNGRVFQLDWQKEAKLNAFGSKGEERGQFQRISSLLVLPDGRVAVADSENKKIEIYKIAAQVHEIAEQVRLPTVSRYLPINMKCDSAYRLDNGDALCLDRDEGTVSQYNSRGKRVKDFGKFSSPRAAAISDDAIVIIDDTRLKIFSASGEPQFSGKGYGGSGSAEGKFDSPRGVYIKGDKIYVADTGNQRIQIFSRDGIYLDQIANPAEPEQRYFDEPSSVVVDNQQNIYVADKSLNQLLVFSADRKLLYKMGGNDEQETRPFTRIYDLAMDADNNLYVLCATPNNRYTIQVYNGPRKVISFASYAQSDAGILEPANLTVAKSKRVLVGVYDQDKKRLLHFSYLQVPARVGGVEVVGGSQQAVLSWQAVPGSFIKGYNVFGADTANGEYRFIDQVKTNKTIVKHADEKASMFYKVNAFSALGAVGKFSRPQQDVFISGFNYYKNKQYEKVVETFKDAITSNVEQPEILKYSGLSLLQLNRVDSAVLSFQQMSKIKGFEAEGLNLQIRALVAAKDYIAARAVIDSVIEANIAETATYVFCGELSLKMGDAIGAITCLEEALSRDAKNIDAHFFMGDAYVRLGIIDKGLEEFNRAAEIAPDNADVWYRSGLIMQQLEKNDTAIEHFNRALEIDNKHASAKLALAQSYLLKRDYDQVKTIAISLAGQKDTAAEGQYLLGQAAMAQNKHGEALLALVKATRLDEKHAGAWLSLADVYVKMGQADKQRVTLVKAVEADPLSFKAAYKLGQYDLTSKQYQNAADSLRQAVNLRMDHFDARFALANALYQAGNYNQAFVDAQEAAKLKPDAVPVIVLLADISNRQGKIGKSIDYMKQAMAKQENSAELHLALGKLYVENNLFEQAQTQLDKAALLEATSAAPHVLLGELFLKRRLFDKSIAAYDRAVSLEPSAENKRALDAVYAEKKKSLEFKSNAPQIVLKDLRLEQVFSAAYKQYANKPVGRIRLQNTSGTDYGNLKLTFAIKGYMDFPTTTEIPKLSANSTEEIDLLASFNNRILDIDEDTGVQVEVALQFVRDGRDDAIRLTQPMTIYGKNAIVWGAPNMVGAFVTPKDDTLRDFVRQAINENKPEPGPLNANLVSAMTLFDVLSAHGIRYVVDPNNPYTRVQSSQVDYVQFSRETLKIKSGDCDDLSVLLSAGLENLGIETAILDVPGHLLMMFNTGLSADKRDRISLQDDLLVIRDNQVWIPIEATMIGTSFAEAWAEGARKYHLNSNNNALKVTELKQAWTEFLPVTLKPASYALSVPAKAKVAPLVNREQSILLQKSLDRLVKPYEVMAATDPGNMHALMQVAIIYAKYGLYTQAHKTFDRILESRPDDSAVHNNRANIYYAKGEYDRAIETYGYAEQLAANDPGIKMNLAMSYYQLGQLAEARDKFNEATTISDQLGQQYAGLGKLLSR
ncbi:MAG: tetratricopeptide repeat protein [Gammaproteobacteria bacterium]|nr:tetratricopeptide repeat protein [Gammaproteobacteria bacterium]